MATRNKDYVVYSKDLADKSRNQFNTAVKEFNDSYKLGIDLGKTTGVAIVKQGKIITAKTLVDLHDDSLEKRRAIRRGRRTRIAHKKRLARLRSWVLRQKINGRQLPDPYKIMKDKAYWSVYNKFKVDNGTGWIQAIKDKRDLQPDEFVRALTILFRKRGYRADKRLYNLSDKDFSLLIKNLKPPINKYESEQLLEELSKRTETGEFDAKDGKVLEKRIKKTRAESKDFTAKQRDEIENDLKEIVDKFTKLNNLSDKASSWEKALIHILNKPVRKARFDNRILIKCKIKGCNKNTPSKEKVREYELKMALFNARSENQNVSEKDLDEFRKNVTELYTNKNSKNPNNSDISTLRKNLNSYFRKAKIKKGMHDQIRTLIFEKLSGRSRYCKEHLKEFCEKQVQLDSINYGVNPKAEQHDRRVINFIEKLIFKRKMIDPKELRYITIEAPEPVTKRAKKGEAPQKIGERLKDRLAKLGIDIYTGEKLTNGFETEHIFPASRYGPSIEENEVASNRQTNKEKGDRTPYEWLKDDKERWDKFEERVNSLYAKGKINKRKKEILLNTNQDYPGLNPTDLAKTGGRVGAFVQDLQKLFKEHHCEVPQTLIQKNKPIIQVVRGSATQQLRWKWAAMDPKIIPLEKDRKSSFNHAEDAVLAASLPPYNWRLKIYRETAKIRRNVGGKENVVERPDLPIKTIAPNWSEFNSSRKEPIVEIIGKKKMNWKTSFMDQSFYKYTGNVNTKFPKLPIHKFENNKRKIKYNPKGGTIAFLTPHDGPKRLVQIKPASEAVIIYEEGGKIKRIRRFITPIIEMYNQENVNKKRRLDFVDQSDRDEIKKLDDLKKKGIKYKEVKRYDMVPLIENGKTNFYYVTKLGSGAITVQNEMYIKAEPERVKSKSGYEYNKKAGERILKDEDFRLILKS